jgi:hypothetical protein
VPEEILEHAPTVEILDLSRNALDSLPEWLPQLRSLKVLFLSGNRFREVPSVIGRCHSLRMLGMRGCQIEQIPEDALPSSLVWLTLTDNHLRSLPRNIGSAHRLRKLLLAGNHLAELPDSFRALRSLELLRLSANQFEELPAWLFELPELAWLAVAGNPCTTTSSATDMSAHAPIPWSELTIGEELGRGASGSTYRATHSPPNEPAREVAVKVFQSTVSSDGDTGDEIAAAVRAGHHPHLTSTIAPFVEHPEHRAGLVLELVPRTFVNLAAPPSFESCTRDVYAESCVFTFSTALGYASYIACAAAHLHQCGIVHGDLYAHNTLVDGASALLSDFGAACFSHSLDPLNRASLERIEVRAMGILVEELIARVSESDRTAHADRIARIENLVNCCLDSAVSARPSFDTVGALLAAESR